MKEKILFEAIIPPGQTIDPEWIYHLFQNNSDQVRYLVLYEKEKEMVEKEAGPGAWTITPEHVDGVIADEGTYKLGSKTTAVVLTLKNGFEVVGTSACVDPASYCHATGKKYARERAVSKVYELLAYELQTRKALA